MSENEANIAPVEDASDIFISNATDQGSRSRGLRRTATCPSFHGHDVHRPARMSVLNVSLWLIVAAKTGHTS